MSTQAEAEKAGREIAEIQGRQWTALAAAERQEYAQLGADSILMDAKDKLAADELAGRELAKSTGRDWLTLTTIERADFIRMAAAENPIREARKHAERAAAGLLTAAQSKLTAAEFAAIVNAAKADAYRDVRREMVWKTEAYKAMVPEIVHLSDALADRVTACGGHYQQPSLTPRFPEGTPEYVEYATKLRTALAEPGAFDFLMEI